MQEQTAFLLVLLFTASAYLILDRSFVRMLFGFALLSNAANLFVLAVSGDPVGLNPPLLNHNAGSLVDPLPQALILTAIVIGLGMIAFLIVLFLRVAGYYDTVDVLEMDAAFENEQKQSNSGEGGLD